MLFTVPQNFEFVKNFFQSLSDVARSSQEQQLLSLPHSEALVKNFFSEVFELGSRSISGNLCRLPHLVAAVKWFFHSTLWRSAYRADSFVRIPNLSPFVNTFFAFFTFSDISHFFALS